MLSGTSGKYWILLLSLIAFSEPAKAAPVECAGVQNDLDRLACYDREVGRTPTATKPFTSGSWQVHSQKSALTDRTDVFASVMSNEAVTCKWNNSAKVRLMLRCLDNATALILDTECHVTSSEYNDYGDVTYRLDEDKAAKVGMVESTDNKSLGLWRGGSSIPMIKRMLGKNTMIVKFTPYGDSPVTATFNIAGIDEASKPVRAACNW